MYNCNAFDLNSGKQTYVNAKRIATTVFFEVSEHAVV